MNEDIRDHFKKAAISHGRENHERQYCNGISLHPIRELSFISGANYGYELAISLAQGIIERMEYAMDSKNPIHLQARCDAVKEWKELIQGDKK